VPANSESLARRIPLARLLLWEGAGHFFWATRPQELVDELAAFL
jgi:pimeloyl-ACP methyl ester carboxylesterase